MERGREDHNMEGASQGGPPAWRSFDVDVGYDNKAKVYFVITSDIPGLNVETKTFEALVEIVMDAAPDLLGESGRAHINFKTLVDLISSDGR